MIEITHLRKEYADTIALENLDLQVPDGEVFGLIGPNGAGKTTLIRILATLLEPTYGVMRINGVDAIEDPLKVHPFIGYMSDFFSLYEDMIVWHYLDHFARCYGVPHHRRAKMIDDVLDLVSLEVRRDSEIKTLSRGMRQRLCFAKTLIHEPKLLLLDEPASGMDPAGRLEFREMLKKLKEMGRTIVISSHILSDMTEFCTSIGIMEQGRMIEHGRVSDIIEKLQTGFMLEVELLSDTARCAQLLSNHPNIRHVQLNNDKVQARFGGTREQFPALHAQLVDAKLEVVSFSVRQDNLEDIYMRISRHQTS